MITNPCKSIKLRSNDLVFVLAQSDPSSPETWDDYNYFNNQKSKEDEEKDNSEFGAKKTEAGKQDMMGEHGNEHDMKSIDPPFAEQKQLRNQFDDIFKEVTGMLRQAEEDVKTVHKTMNARDSTIVQDITSQIDNIVHSIMTFPDPESQK